MTEAKTDRLGGETEMIISKRLGQIKLNERRAKEVISRDHWKTIDDEHTYEMAAGYLECLEQVQPLIEALLKCTELCVCQTESDMFIENAKKAITAWEEKQK